MYEVLTRYLDLVILSDDEYDEENEWNKDSGGEEIGAADAKTEPKPGMLHCSSIASSFWF